MNLLNHKKYQELLQDFIMQFPDWDKLSGKSMMISGATGMIGSFLIDAIMVRNGQVPTEKRCKIIATSRTYETAIKRFPLWFFKKDFTFFSHDISNPISTSVFLEIPDYFIHAASSTHPMQYATEPINTIFSNVLGIRNILDLAFQKIGSRTLLLSSVEVYGENRGDTEYFDEHYCGFIDCNTLRAGYPEAKRLSEALCQAYISEKGIDAVIIRLPRAYGPTLRMNDTKALSQFLKKGINKEDIVLKSKGDQFYSYAFVSDIALGILYVLTRGFCGEAYNLADKNSDITLKELAFLVAQAAGTNVTFELPDEKEKKGYSNATKAILASDKLQALGWNAHYNLREGIQLTMEIIRGEKSKNAGKSI